VQPPKTDQNRAQNGPNGPGPTRPTRARRPPAHQAATWAWAGKVASRLGLKRPAHPRSTCGRRISSDGHAGVSVDQNPPPGARVALTLGHFFPAPRSRSSLLLCPPRDGGRRCGAAAGLLAGECARLDVSAPPSSGLGVAGWPTHHGAVEIRELGMARDASVHLRSVERRSAWAPAALARGAWSSRWEVRSSFLAGSKN
jgi:hypothetical protein